MHENEVSAVVLDAGIEVHRTLGPGLLESVYEVGADAGQRRSSIETWSTTRS